MTRLLVDPGLYDPDNRYTSAADVRAEVLRIRDVFRAVLDPDTNQTNWQVTDIFTWSGFSTGEAHGFIVYHMDGGAPSSRTGPAWLYFWGGGYTSGASFIVYEFDQFTSSQRNNFFISSDGTTNFGTDGQMGIHYNETAGTTTPYGAGEDADGTFPGGDFSAPSINPNTAIENFIPAGKLRGITSSSTNGLTTTSQFGTRVIFIFDDVKPFSALYHAFGSETYTRGFWCLGEIVKPYRSTDVYNSGTLFINMDGDGTVVNDEHFAYTDAGVEVELEDYYHEFFTRDNVPFADGTFPWDTVPLVNPASYYKGWLDSDVIRVMGPFQSRHQAQFNNGQFIKIHEALCFPYAPSQPSFVYPDPTDAR